MSPLRRVRISRKAGQHLLRLLGSAHRVALQRRLQAITLGQLEDSRRPLLFSLLPRMLRRDGTTPQSLQGAFRYIDQRRDRALALPVSSRRWSRALATSRKLAARRAARGGDP